MNKPVERLYNGIVKENPTFVLMLGMCPTLAVTTSAINGLGMGLTTAAVLALSNLMISLLRHVIPDKVRIPAFIVIIASFVTVVELLLEAYLPALNDALGVYIPLIVVNCIILGRAESYAYQNPPVASLFDGIGMGLGFSLALTCIGAVRELLGAGTLFGYQVMPDSYTPMVIFILAPGAFFVLAALTALQNYMKARGEKAGKDMSRIQSGCGQNCATCSQLCSGKTDLQENAEAGNKENIADRKKDTGKKVSENKDSDSKASEKKKLEEKALEKKDSTVQTEGKEVLSEKGLQNEKIAGEEKGQTEAMEKNKSAVPQTESKDNGVAPGKRNVSGTEEDGPKILDWVERKGDRS